MKVLDLCAGIGGFSLGLERAGMATVAFCEIEAFPQQVLKANFPGVPVYDDVRTLTAERLAADGIISVDVITAGYPCQPFSLAGKRRGQDDPRHVWPEVYRLVKEIRPDWCIFENVVGHVTMGLEDVLIDLENAGYSVQSFVIPAAGVGAPHMRDRVWIVAENSERTGTGDKLRTAASQERGASQAGGEGLRQAHGTFGTSWPDPTSHDVAADSYSSGLQELNPPGESDSPEQHTWSPVAGRQTGPTLSGFCGSHDGISDFLDVHRVPPLAVGQRHRNKRLKALGNAVVPAIPYMIGRAIMEVEQHCS